MVIQLLQGNEIIDEQSTTLTFKFLNVIPAVYNGILSVLVFIFYNTIILVKIRDDYSFWWDTSKHSIEVIDKNIKGLQFQQSGYKIEIQSSHPAEFVCFNLFNIKVKTVIFRNIL